MKITLATARPEDSKELAELMNDSEIYNEFLKGGNYTADTAKNEIEFFRSKSKNPTPEHFFVLIKATTNLFFRKNRSNWIYIKSKSRRHRFALFRIYNFNTFRNKK